MYFKHDLDYTYPNVSDAHMLKVERKKDLTLDESYSFLPRGILYKVLRGVYFLLLNLIVFPITRLTHGLRIEGKENLKKHKKALKNGAITISNHVFMWDYLCVLKAIRPHLAYFPAWKANLEGGTRAFVRLSGGIPIPENDIHAMARFNAAIEEALESGKWLHFFPEGSLWFFYPDIRPLKKAVFHYSARFLKPIIPITMSFRPRRGIFKLFSKKPFVDLHVGEPIFPDSALPRHEAAEKMQKEAYHVMQLMNGIRPGDASYNEDLVLSHYKKTM